ncbi:MAG: insulinase family protein [Prevotella sp.]|nr:insulinase family protein [Prevotella sp.]
MKISIQTFNTFLNHHNMKKERLAAIIAAAVITTIAFTLTACGGKYKYETVKGDDMNARIYTLDNGLRVYLSVNKETPRIQTFIAVRTGSKNDPAETTGLAHYLEHLMFKGTQQFGTTNAEAEAPFLDEIEQRYEAYRQLTDQEARRKAYHEIDSVSQLAAQYNIPNEYDKLMAAIGAEGTNAYTSNDVTCYTEDIPSNEVENWAKIQADRFQNMVIRGFHTELEAVYEEYNIGIAQDQRKLWQALSAMLFPGHPYGTQSTIGTQEHLKNPSITNIKAYFEHWYRPNNVAICMSGDFDPDEVIATIDKYFGSWQPGEDVKQPEFPALAPIAEQRDTTVYGLETEAIWMGWRFEQGNSLQVDTLNLIENILSNGTAGLFDLDINQQMKMLYAWAGVERLHDYSAFIMGGTPRDGQSLDEAKAVMLEEMEKLKAGNFSDDLLPAVINNAKLQYYNSLENNRARADKFVDAFINEIPWEQEVKWIDRISNITKEEVVAFANNHFNDNYVAIYKRQGEDKSLKKIDKPAITPIPTNRDTVSQFVRNIQEAKVKPIQPKFVDFKKDLNFGEITDNLPFAYVKNTGKGSAFLGFRYEFGNEADLRFNYAADYLDYLGTDSLTNEQLKQQFYKLACNYKISVGERNIDVLVNGLSENIPEALSLLEHLLQNAKPDKDAWQQYVSLEEKGRNDSKLNQRANFSALVNYGIYGEYNPTRHDIAIDSLRKTDPQELINLLKQLPEYPHTLLYYGSMSQNSLRSMLEKSPFLTENGKLDIPENNHYIQWSTPKNEILIAPYDAKNIYMRMIHNEDREWNPDEAAIKALFNEYYGGGMNTIVFQELREARGLAYNAYAAYMEPTYKDQKEYFFTHIITQNDKMMDCVHQFHAILDTIPESQQAFDIAKEALTKRLASQRTTRFGLINAWLVAKWRGIDYDVNERIYRALPNITLKDVVKFEQEQIARKPYRYVILGNEKDLDIKSLEEIAPVKRLTTEEIFGY